MVIKINLANTCSPEERINRLFFEYIWPYYEKNKYDLIRTAKETGLKLYFVKRQMRLNPFLVKKILTDAKKIYKTRNTKTKMELLIEGMIVKSKDPRESMAYRFGTAKVRKEIDIIIAQNTR